MKNLASSGIFAASKMLLPITVLQPFRQQRAGGNPAGADLPRRDGEIRHQTFGAMDSRPDFNIGLSNPRGRCFNGAP